MNNQSHLHDFEDIEPPLDAAVQAVLAEPVPDEAVERVKTRAKQLEIKPTLPPPRMQRSLRREWKHSRVILGSFAVAVALLIMATGVTLWLDRAANQAFAQVIERVKAAHSVRLLTSTRFGQQPEIDGQMHLEGNRLRWEQVRGLLVQVVDLDRKRAVFLDTQRMLAQEVDIDTEVAKAFANPIDQLRRAQSSDAVSIGAEILRGRRTLVYRLPKVDLLGMKGSGEMLVWVDAESELPAKIVIRDTNPKAETEIRFDQLVWNEPLDAQLFTVSIPKGFQTGIVASTPRRREPRPSDIGTPDSAPALADGVLGSERVPAHIIWDSTGKMITALLRDPESIPPLERRPNELRQWEVATGKVQWSETIGGAGCVAGTANGDMLATVIGFEVQLRAASSGKVTRRWVTDKPLSPLVFSPDGKTLAAGITQWGPFGGSRGKQSGGVQFWDVERASLVRSISDDQPVTFVRYSGNGKCLATSSNEGPVKLWDVTTGALIRLFPGVSQAAFSPDGETIACQSAVASADKFSGRVDLYRLRDGSLVKSFVSAKGTAASWLLCITFSPDGHLLAATDWNGTVTLWDVATGERKQTNMDQRAGVLTAAFAPNGATMATGSENQMLRLWKISADSILPAVETK
jgi:outer membrane lipoprotein-sorting protein